ncbi:MAG: phosphatase PAP2 family protein [Aquabacterium sp.]|nr:phosphatase PAP2 family protein [Aquabacterium sp.]
MNPSSNSPPNWRQRVEAVLNNTTSRLAMAALLGVATALVLLAGFRLTCPDSACRQLQWDDAVSALMRSWQTPALDSLFIALTWLGSLVVLLPLALLMAWYLDHRHGPRTACFVPFALLGAALWAHAFKLLVNRPRPDALAALINLPADMSYPSAHTLQVGAFVLAWILCPNLRCHTLTAIALLLMAPLVGISRLYLQVHFASDVMFGAAAAVLWVLALRSLPIWKESTA